MTQQNAALAEESAASAGALSSQIHRLNELVATFRTDGNVVSLARAPAEQDDADPYEWDERRRA
jgi:methyl-accepting chemotaxis protein